MARKTMRINVAALLRSLAKPESKPEYDWKPRHYPEHIIEFETVDRGIPGSSVRARRVPVED